MRSATVKVIKPHQSSPVSSAIAEVKVDLDRRRWPIEAVGNAVQGHVGDFDNAIQDYLGCGVWTVVNNGDVYYVVD